MIGVDVDSIFGDVNHDGEVNIADVNALIDRVLCGEGDLMPYDLNGDSEVNIADVNVIIDLIFSGS